jgi:hypothetical protein
MRGEEQDWFFACVRCSEVVRGSQDERWLAPDPEELAERFVMASQRLLPLVLEDLGALDPDVGVVAEGPQLFPSLVAPYLGSPHHGLWLLPTDEFQRRSLEARAGDSAKFTSDAARALEKRLARNKLLDDRTRSEAEVLGLRVIDVDGRQDVEAAVERVIDLLPIDRLPRARVGSRRSRIRQAENDTMVRNVRSFRADLGPDAPPEWPVPFLCECDRLGCSKLVELTPSQAAVADRPIVSPDDRPCRRLPEGT